MGPYIADFVSFKRKLIIEIDGGQHGVENTKERDKERTKRLKDGGYQVLRFWNNDVLMNMGGVLERIREAVR